MFIWNFKIFFVYTSTPPNSKSWLRPCIIYVPFVSKYNIFIYKIFYMYKLICKNKQPKLMASPLGPSMLEVRWPDCCSGDFDNLTTRVVALVARTAISCNLTTATCYQRCSTNCWNGYYYQTKGTNISHRNGKSGNWTADTSCLVSVAEAEF